MLSEKGISRRSIMNPTESECCIFQDPVRQELDSLEVMFRETLHSEVPLIDEICDYICAAPGKRIRPSLLFLASRSLGGDAYDSLTAGLAVELIHTATLIHDDIIDDHRMRRGKETVYSRWNSNVATIMGDFLYSKAFDRLGRAGMYEIIGILARTTNIMSIGEMMQFQQVRNIEVSESGYMDMIYSKTASLFSASSECGAVIGSNGNGNGYRSLYSGFGRNIGLAFQITDDLFDYIAVDESIGKPTASDFTDGRVTLPFIMAFRNAPDEKRRRLSELFHSGFDHEKNWGEVVSFVQHYGGIEYSLKKARELGEKAKQTLGPVDPSRERDALFCAADYVVQRVDPFSGRG